MSQGSITESDSDEEFFWQSALANERIEDVAQPSDSIATTNEIPMSLGDLSASLLKFFKHLFGDDEEDHHDCCLNREKRTTCSLYSYAIYVGQFLTAVSKGSFSGAEDETFWCCIACLYDERFLSYLLLHRQVLLSKTDASGYELSGHVAVTWVDPALSLLSESIPEIVVALSGINGCSDRVKDIPVSLRRQRLEDSLKVASQLPGSFSKFVETVRSKFTSPAANRLCVSLLFASIKVRSDICGTDIWPLRTINSEALLASLDASIKTILEGASSDRSLDFTDPVQGGKRAEYAMLLSLYATADSASRRKEGANGLPFRPRTLSYLLDLLYCVLPPERSVVESLDYAQLILLKCGHFVPWMWAQWDDARLMNFDVVVIATTNWFFHIDSSNTDDYESHYSISGFASETFIAAIKMNTRAVVVAIYHQLEKILGMKHNDEFSALKTCYKICLYRILCCLSLTTQGLLTDLPEDYSLLIIQTLLRLIILPNTVTRDWIIIKEKVLEILGTAQQPAVNKAFLLCTEDHFGIFCSNVEHAVERLAILDNLLDLKAVRDTHILLEFLGTLLRTNSMIHLWPSIYDLLAKLTVLTNNQVHGKSLASMKLRAAILNCLYYLESGQKSINERQFFIGATGKNKHNIDTEAILLLALDMNCFSIELAASLATFVPLLAKRITNDCLLFAEAWDYLRDSLLLTMGARFEPRAGEVSSIQAVNSICKSLEWLISRADEGMLQYLRASPLTLNLAACLWTVMNTNASKAPDGDGEEGCTAAAQESLLKKIRQTLLKD